MLPRGNSFIATLREENTITKQSICASSFKGEESLETSFRFGHLNLVNSLEIARFIEVATTMESNGELQPEGCGQTEDVTIGWCEERESQWISSLRL